MRYEFEPRQTRDTVARIVAAFGKAGGAPHGLTALFQYLANLSPAQLERFAREATPVQIDQLCQHYPQAPNATCLCAIATVLCHRNDARWSTIASYTFCQLPELASFDQLRSAWLKNSDKLSHSSDQAWLVLWLENPTPPPALEYAVECLRTGRFTLDSRDALFFQTPLFFKLADWLFDEGGPLITWLHQEQAALFALVYLNRLEEQRVRNYLRHYPQSGWSVSLLESIYRLHGRPDAKTSPFYKDLEEPTLWGIRKTLFTARMLESASPKPQQAYWQGRLHRCQDWQFKDHFTEIQMAPLQIIEKLEETQVTLRDGTIKRIAHDSDYVKSMDALLKAYLGW